MCGLLLQDLLLFVRLSLCMFMIYLSVCLSVCLSVSVDNNLYGLFLQDLLLLFLQRQLKLDCLPQLHSQLLFNVLMMSFSATTASSVYNGHIDVTR